MVGGGPDLKRGGEITSKVLCPPCPFAKAMIFQKKFTATIFNVEGSIGNNSRVARLASKRVRADRANNTC